MTNCQPKFSVIMNCRNSARYLREALTSVYAQTESSWEIIFFDNQSTDESPTIAKSYDSRVRYVRAEVSLSLGEARNEAMRVASGEFVTFLDCDDVWVADKLLRQRQIFEQYPNVGFAYSEYHDWFEATGRKSLAVRSDTGQAGDLFRRELAKYRVGILTVAFRRSLLEKTAEWFDPRLNLTEDYDFFLRLLSLTDGYYSPLSAGDYRVHANNLSSVLRAKWSDEMSLVYEKLKGLVPDFETRYATETAVLRAKIAYLYARNRIADGDGAGARAYLKPFRFQSASYFLLYLIGFAPTGLWTSGYRLYRRLRYGLSDSPA